MGSWLGFGKTQTIKMLEDPDALMRYPEVRAVLDGTAVDEVSNRVWYMPPWSGLGISWRSRMTLVLGSSSLKS